VRNLLNFAFFQAGWFACVLGAAAGMSWAAVASAVVICVLHLVFVSSDRAGELRLILAVTVCGSCVSAFNAWNGAVTFAPGMLAIAGVPPWLMALWALFATILRHSLGWLRGRYVVAAIAGLVGSPLSYRAAAAFGAVDLHPEVARGMLVVGVTWAAAVPATMWLAERTASAEPDRV
jgi:hypothetical protein